MSGAGGISTGGGAGGFTQSPNAFGGLNNTDLRPRRRGRPVPLLDTTWPRVMARRRLKGAITMRKALTDLVELLGQNVGEIANSTVDDRDDRLKKSFDEFQEILLEQLDPVLPPDEEPLEKGLNHIAVFANSLRDMANKIHAIQTGEPSWMINGDGPNSGRAEPLPEAISEMLDGFLNHGVITLRAMVNDTAELPIDDDDLARAEQAGELVKLDTVAGEVMLKTSLPEEYLEYVTDPVDLAGDYATMARLMKGQAIEMAAYLDEEGALPEEFLQEFPELLEDDMEKAFPPKKPAAAGGSPFPPKKPAAGGGSPFPPKQSAQQTAGSPPDDENLGEGGDPNSADDPGSDPGAGDLTDDAPQNPIEMMVRLASIIVVVGGSIMQAQGEGDPATMGGANGSPMDATTGPGLTRGEPEFEAPLQKILDGEVEVDPTLADALEELIELRKAEPTLRKQLLDSTAELKTLQATVSRLQQQAAPPKGVLTDLRAATKADDGMPREGSNDPMLKAAEEVERLRETDPEAAARQLLKMAHMTGGRPLSAIS